MGSWPSCKWKPGGAQATVARTQDATLQAFLRKNQCWTPLRLGLLCGKSEQSWDRTQKNEFISQKRKQCTCLGIGALGPPVYTEWLQTTGPAPFQLSECQKRGRSSFLPPPNQYPVSHIPSPNTTLCTPHDLLCITVDLISSMRECMKILPTSLSIKNQYISVSLCEYPDVRFMRSGRVGRYLRDSRPNVPSPTYLT